MGQLYAVIPARLNQILYDAKARPQWRDMKDSTFMPLQFYVFRLNGNGDDGTNGVIRIEPEESRRTGRRIDHDRLLCLLQKTFAVHCKYQQKYYPPRKNWFACMGKGSVIWAILYSFLYTIQL